MAAAVLERRTGQVLTTGDVADRLGITPQSLRSAELRGEIPPARRDFGSGDRYYNESEIRVLVAHFKTK